MGAGGGSPGRLVPRTHSASFSPTDSLASRAPALPFTPVPSERFNCARPTVLAWQSPGPLPPSLPPAPARVAPSGPVSGNSVLTIRELVRVTGLRAPPEQDPALPPFHQPPDRRQALGWCSPCSFHQLKIAVLRATDRRLGKRGSQLPGQSLVKNTTPPTHTHRGSRVGDHRVPKGLEHVP